MDRRTGVFLNVGEILAGQAPAKQFDINFKLDERIEDGVAVLSPIQGTAYFVKADEGVVGSFQVQTRLTFLCSADGEGFEEPLRLDFQHEFRKNADPDFSPVLPGNSVDVLPAIRDEIIVSIPMKPLCPKHRDPTSSS